MGSQERKPILNMIVKNEFDAEVFFSIDIFSTSVLRLA